MQCSFTARRLVRTVAAAALAALLTASCAQHVYQPGTYSAATDTPRYTEDWFAAARAGRGCPMCGGSRRARPTSASSRRT